MLAFLATAAALAGVPQDVTPVAAPMDVRQEYATWLEELGRPPAELACDPLWAGQALVCFKVADQGKRRWVTTPDLITWGVNVIELREEVASRALQAPPPRREQVPDTRLSYFIADEGPWTLALALNPQHLPTLVGSPVAMVAVPADGVLLAWTPGSAELDKIMAVAVREAWETGQGPVSAVVHSWDGKRWRPFGEAVPTEE